MPGNTNSEIEIFAHSINEFITSTNTLATISIGDTFDRFTSHYQELYRAQNKTGLTQLKNTVSTLLQIARDKVTAQLNRSSKFLTFNNYLILWNHSYPFLNQHREQFREVFFTNAQSQSVQEESNNHTNFIQQNKTLVNDFFAVPVSESYHQSYGKIIQIIQAEKNDQKLKKIIEQILGTSIEDEKINHPLFEIIKLLAKEYPSYFSSKNIAELFTHSKYIVDLKRAFFTLHLVNLLTPNNFTMLLEQPQYALNLAFAFRQLHENNILTTDNKAALLAHAQYAEDLASAFNLLHHTELLTIENRTALLIHAQYVSSLVSIFYLLYRTKLRTNLLTTDNITALLNCAEDALALKNAYNLLDNDYLLTADNLTALLTQTQYAENLAHTFCFLHQFQSLSTANREALLEHAQYAADLILVFEFLHRFQLLTTDNLAALLTQAQYADNLARAFAFLHQNQLLTIANLAALLTQAQYAYNLARAFEFLHQFQLLTPDNRTALLTQPQYAYDLARAFRHLHNDHLLTTDNRIALLAHAQYTNNWIDAFFPLWKAHLLTAENKIALLAHVQYAKNLTSAFDLLHKKNHLLTADNLAALLMQAQYAENLARAFCLLHQAQLLNADNRATLLTLARAHLGKIASGQIYGTIDNRYIPSEKAYLPVDKETYKTAEQFLGNTQLNETYLPYDEDSAIFYFQEAIKSSQEPWATYAKENLACFLGSIISTADTERKVELQKLLDTLSDTEYQQRVKEYAEHDAKRIKVPEPVAASDDKSAASTSSPYTNNTLSVYKSQITYESSTALQQDEKNAELFDLEILPNQETRSALTNKKSS